MSDTQVLIDEVVNELLQRGFNLRQVFELVSDPVCAREAYRFWLEARFFAKNATPDGINSLIGYVISPRALPGRDYDDSDGKIPPWEAEITAWADQNMCLEEWANVQLPDNSNKHYALAFLVVLRRLMTLCVV